MKIPAVVACLLMGAAVSAQQAQTPPAPPPSPSPTGYQDTPMQPNGKWHIHDGTRPQPRVVTPGPLVSPAPPSDAVVLLGTGQDLGRWQMTQGGGPVSWPIENGVLSSGKGMIRTAQDDFTDYQLHLEFATPSVVKGNSQGRGNSGVFLNGVFEIQVLDSFENVTYPDGQAAAMYGQFPPMVNASRRPGEWQSYDIIFSSPRFKGTTLERPAIVTVLHNGVTVHAAQAFLGPTGTSRSGSTSPPTRRASSASRTTATRSGSATSGFDRSRKRNSDRKTGTPHPLPAGAPLGTPRAAFVCDPAAADPDHASCLAAGAHDVTNSGLIPHCGGTSRGRLPRGRRDSSAAHTPTARS